MEQDVEYVEYVKGSGHDNWHWCKNCTQYPLYIYERRFDRPESKLCPQCKEKEDNKDCKTQIPKGQDQTAPHIDKFFQ